MGIFFGKFIIFGVFGKKSLDIRKNNYFEKNFLKKSHSIIHTHFHSNKSVDMAKPFKTKNIEAGFQSISMYLYLKVTMIQSVQ